jgi:fucose permease
VADELRRARRAVRAFFFLIGVAVASWAAIVPFAKTRLTLDEATLGTILLASGVGTIVSSLAAAPLLARGGSRQTLAGAGAAVCAFPPLLALAPSAPALAALLFGFGTCTGLLGVAANAQAVAVEARSGRPLMSSFHAQFSLGGLTGAGASSLLLAAGASIAACAGVLAAALLALVLAQRHGLVREDPPAAPAAAPFVASARRARGALPPAAVLVIGVMTLSLYLAEGAVLDWAAVFLHEVRGLDVSTAALGYAAFSVAMAVGRLGGDRVVANLGPVAVVRYGSAVAAAGFVVLVLAPWRVAGLAGCALIGLGASNVVPTLISAAARVSDLNTAAAVSTVVAVGTCGLLAGPALVGYLAHATSLRAALGALALLLLAVSAAARAVRARGGAA